MDGNWRKQVPIAGYAVDFASHAKRLVVEVDGPQHNPALDEMRDQSVRQHGYRVIRFTADEVHDDVDSVEEAIWLALNAPPLDGEGWVG
jgi:very-short-patch-repair endonuclease